MKRPFFIPESGLHWARLTLGRLRTVGLWQWNLESRHLMASVFPATCLGFLDRWDLLKATKVRESSFVYAVKFSVTNHDARGIMVRPDHLLQGS